MNAFSSNSLSGAAFLLGSVFCWGAVPVLLRSLTDVLDAWTANGIRYPMAAVLYWPVLAVAFQSGRLDRCVIGRCLAPALLALGGQILWALAPYHLPASAIGFFVRMSLLWSLAAAMAFFPDERRLLASPRFHAGILLAVAGFLVLSVNKLKLDAEVSGTGIVIILACSFFFGLYAVSVRQFLRGIHPLVAFGVVSQIVSAGTLAAMLTAGRYADLLSLRKPDWVIVAASSILGIALGHVFLYASVKRLGAAITSGAQTLTPFVTAALAWAILGESLSAVGWCGGVGMVVGATVLLMAQNQLVLKQATP
jgi:drug/metabolite transporter (DMT)-like permease